MRTPSQASPRGIVTDLPLLLVAVVWGSSFLAVKHLATQQTVLPMLVLRFALVLPPLGLLVHRRLRTLDRAEWTGGALLGLILGAIFLLETFGTVHTSPTNAGLIISLNMLLTPLAESALSRTRLPGRFLLAAAASLLGVGLLTQSGGLRAPSYGDLLVLAAAVVRTVHVLVMGRTKSLRETDSGALTWVQLASAAAVFALVTPFTGAPAPWHLAAGYGPLQWSLLLYLALFCTLFAFAVQMWAVRATSPSRVSLLLGTEPLWAAVLGIALGGDRLTVPVLAGAVLVLAGTEAGRRSSPAEAAQPPVRELVNEGSSGRPAVATRSSEGL
jgi:drug/metabolite transporter (DMT)-like permease